MRKVAIVVCLLLLLGLTHTTCALAAPPPHTAAQSHPAKTPNRAPDELLIERINPMTYVGEEEYRDFWRILFSSLLQGIWARIFAVVCFILSFWFGVRRQQILWGLIFFVGSLVFAYLGALLHLVGLT